MLVVVDEDVEVVELVEGVHTGGRAGLFRPNNVSYSCSAAGAATEAP